MDPFDQLAGDLAFVTGAGDDQVETPFRAQIGQQRKIGRRPPATAVARPGMDAHIGAAFYAELQCTESAFVFFCQRELQLFAHGRHAEMSHQRQVSFDLVQMFGIFEEILRRHPAFLVMETGKTNGSEPGQHAVNDRTVALHLEQQIEMFVAHVEQESGELAFVISLFGEPAVSRETDQPVEMRHRSQSVARPWREYLTEIVEV